jgi:NifU-like protein involved in Fe-S cluster formation
MKKIDWSPIHDNSSSADALCEFVHGASIKEAVKYCWDPAVKQIFKQLKKLPVKTARHRARDFWRKHFS